MDACGDKELRRRAAEVLAKRDAVLKAIEKGRPVKAELLHSIIHNGRAILRTVHSSADQNVVRQVRECVYIAKGWRLVMDMHEIKPSDRKVLIGMYELWKLTALGHSAANPADQTAAYLELAKERLSDPDLLREVYQDHRFPRLVQDILDEFLNGDISEAQAQERLDAYISLCREYLHLFFAADLAESAC
ncbi:MAG: hypothetical protein Q8P78_02985 [bacterium]|nr:hypothetical protein [bacterium]